MNPLTLISTLVRAAMIAVLATQVAVAGTAAFSFRGMNLTWDVIAVSFGLCTLSGVASLLNRISTELKANGGELPNLPLFIATNLTGSTIAGILSFVLAMRSEWDVWTTLGTMIVASFMGAHYVEKGAELLSGGKLKVPAPGEKVESP